MSFDPSKTEIRPIREASDLTVPLMANETVYGYSPFRLALVCLREGSDSAAFVADCRGHLVGYVVVKLIKASFSAIPVNLYDAAAIKRIGVLDFARRQGIGRMLLEEANRYGQNKSPNAVASLVRYPADDQDIDTFFTACGYMVQKVIRNPVVGDHFEAIKKY